MLQEPCPYWFWPIVGDWYWPTSWSKNDTVMADDHNEGRGYELIELLKMMAFLGMPRSCPAAVGSQRIVHFAQSFDQSRLIVTSHIPIGYIELRIVAQVANRIWVYKNLLIHVWDQHQLPFVSWYSWEVAESVVTRSSSLKNHTPGHIRYRGTFRRWSLWISRLVTVIVDIRPMFGGYCWLT